MTKILITGGGTAGHVYPALAVIEALRGKAEVELLFVGGRGGVEGEMVKKEGIPYRGIAVGKLRRSVDVRNLIDPLKAAAGYVESLGVVRSFRPAAVFAKGGYVTVPVILAAKSLRIPIVTHESDLVMGLSNRLGHRLARSICVGFPVEMYQGIPRDKLVFTGNPLRGDFARAKGRKFHNQFGLSPSLPTVLVIGGSQGAIGLNELVTGMVPALTKRAQLIHVTGETDLARMEAARGTLPATQSGRYVLYPFLTDMAHAMSTADVVISRAGANALAELAFMGKPAVLIPLPTAASDHQRKNAEYFSKRGAALVLEQSKTSSDVLLKAVDRLLTNNIDRDKLAHAIEELAVPDAAERVAKVILEVAR